MSFSYTYIGCHHRVCLENCFSYVVNALAFSVQCAMLTFNCDRVFKYREKGRKDLGGNVSLKIEFSVGVEDIFGEIFNFWTDKLPVGK